MKFIKYCTNCHVKLVKRANLPWTATKNGNKYYDYWQCPKCKVNYANEKEDKS